MLRKAGISIFLTSCRIRHCAPSTSNGKGGLQTSPEYKFCMFTKGSRIPFLPNQGELCSPLLSRHKLCLLCFLPRSLGRHPFICKCGTIISLQDITKDDGQQASKLLDLQANGLLREDFFRVSVEADFLYVRSDDIEAGRERRKGPRRKYEGKGKKFC